MSLPELTDADWHALLNGTLEAARRYALDLPHEPIKVTRFRSKASDTLCFGLDYVYCADIRALLRTHKAPKWVRDEVVAELVRIRLEHL